MKTVLLTGASGGLWLCLAKKLLEEKYFVVLHYYKNSSEVPQNIQIAPLWLLKAVYLYLPL